MEDLYQYAIEEDNKDELKQYRDYFVFPKLHGTNQDVNYLCGHSLGLQHRDVSSYVEAELRKWREQGVEGHTLEPNKWFEIDEVLRKPMADIVGALPDEVAVMNTLTVNLHLLLIPFYKPTAERHAILIEKDTFPSDMYAVMSEIRLHGQDPAKSLIEAKPQEGQDILRTEDIEHILRTRGHEIAVVMMGGVHFVTGQLFDIKRITELAHQQGCLVGFNLAHAAGNVELHLHDWNVDFACWCTYKYLNGGPGNIAAAFVHERHDLSQMNKLEGWWGHRRTNRFALKRDFDGTPGIASMQLSNPPVLCIASLTPSVKLMSEVSMKKLRAKSVKLTGYLDRLLRQLLTDDVSIITPQDPEQRGTQLSIRLVREPPKEVQIKALQKASQTYAWGTDVSNSITYSTVVERCLNARGIICDKRPPDVIRVAPVPIYTRFVDVYNFVRALKDLLSELYSQ